MSAERKPPPPRDPHSAPPRPGRRGRGTERYPAEPVSRRLPLQDRWEEGFLRLERAGVEPPLSLIVDAVGMLHDATAPSEFERLLQSAWDEPDLVARAAAGSERLRRERLSLDNDPRRLRLPPPSGPRVIVVDEPAGDRRAAFALAGDLAFERMLAAARRENPHAEVLVVTDPGASRAGPGRLGDTAGVRRIGEPVEAWSVAQGCDRLYAVSAHVGFEAALAGTPVTLFGAPFYAGWGFTDDRLLTPRRTRRRSPLEVFAAAHLACARCYDPFTGGRITFEEALEVLSLCVTRRRENAGRTLAVGFASWKRPWLRAMLGGETGGPRLLPPGESPSPAAVQEADRVVAWASREPEGTAETCRASGRPLLRMEDGFIRSAGLGVGLRAGSSYVLDASGVYYDATRPSDLETLLERTHFPPALLERAARLREAVVEAAVSKYNVGSTDLPSLPADRPVVLVAGQVADDASLALGLAEVDDAGLLRRAREADPGALIAFKPHPDVEAGLRPGAQAADGLCDMVLRGVSSPAALAVADRVEVATSLLGFEALLRGKPVRTHGLPFYAGWGLTDDPGCARRTRRLTLDELVAGVLILHPRYVDPRTGLPCPPEVLVRRLAERDPSLGRRTWTGEAVLKALWSAAHGLRRRGQPSSRRTAPATAASRPSRL